MPAADNEPSSSTDIIGKKPKVIASVSKPSTFFMMFETSNISFIIVFSLHVRI